VAGDVAAEGNLTFTVTVTVSPGWIVRQVGDIALAIGPELARAADALARAERLGHYPAIDYLRTRADADTSLLAAMDHVAAIVAEMVSAELRSALRPLCSRADIGRVLVTAYALPRVRPLAPDALQQLARHYTPDTLRLDVSAKARRGEIDADHIRQALAPHFAAVTIAAVTSDTP
jgi:hypothetical protein